MKKRRHHYVWRKYLQPWACGGDSIWCYREGKIFYSNLMGVGQSRDFYKLKELTLQDIEFIRKLALEPTKAKLRELNEGWIQMFNLVFEYKKRVNELGLAHPEIEKEFDKAVHNFEEDYHSHVESYAIKYLDSILNQDISFYYTDEGCMNFAYYLCLQYMRTNNIKEKVCQPLRQVKNINAEGIWNVMRHIFATNMAWTLFADRDKFRMILVNNKSSTPLITCDQPVINTYAVGKLADEIVNDVEFYYPVSPKLAILISEKDKYKTINEIDLQDEDAKLFNMAMISSSHEQIYADSREVLELCQRTEGVSEQKGCQAYTSDKNNSID